MGQRLTPIARWLIPAAGHADSSRAPTWRISSSSRSTTTPFCIRRQCSRADALGAPRLIRELVGSLIREASSFGQLLQNLRRRRSVAIAAPIEQVVDPHLHHLNVAVALGESVAGEESGDPSRNNKCPIIQPKIIILDLRRPIGCESPLNARAHQPAAVGVVVGGGDRCASRQIVDGEVVVADPTAAGLAIKEPVAIRHAEPRSQGRDPSIVGSHLDSSKRRNKYGTSVIVVRSPVDVPFKSENEVADLPVEPELASSDEYAVVISVAKVQAREGVAQVIVAPSSP